MILRLRVLGEDGEALMPEGLWVKLLNEEREGEPGPLTSRHRLLTELMRGVCAGGGVPA